MKIILINGSPKKGDSASELIINALCQRLSSSSKYVALSAMKVSKAEFIEEIINVDAIVIVFPLYVDGIPSHLLRVLCELKTYY